MGLKIKKILIVEDDLSLRPLWENFFRYRTQDVDLSWAVSCEEALKMVQLTNKDKAPFFLIITDIFLAGSGTGMELVTSEEVQKSGAKTVLISVAGRDDIIREYGHQIPTTHVISKPLDFKTYEPIINNILEESYGL